jgi:DeoR/GlpR family transcriptional regulator of sugar metabolism
VAETPETVDGTALTIGDEFARERQHRIALVVEEHGRARVVDLARQFGVSAVTIRKDLARLEEEQRLVRTHGGAVAPGRARPERAFEVRERLKQAEKRAIATAAVELIADGESVAIDASTTGLYVARQLKRHRAWTNLTIVTNGLRIASELAGHPGISVLMLGGWVRHEALSLVGGLGDGVFRRINVQKAIIGAAGFTLDSGLTDATEEEAQIKRAMVGAAREVYAIIDHSKWGRASFVTFCRTERISGVITDAGVSAEAVAEARAAGIEVLIVERASGGRGNSNGVTDPMTAGEPR